MTTSWTCGAGRGRGHWRGRRGTGGRGQENQPAEHGKWSCQHVRFALRVTAQIRRLSQETLSTRRRFPIAAGRVGRTESDEAAGHRLVRRHRLPRGIACCGPGGVAARRVERRRVLPLGPQDAVVAARHVDGGHDVLDRHAQPGHRHRAHPNGVGRQLGLVGVPADRHADGLRLREALAALGRDDRRRVLRAALQRASRRAFLRGFRAIYLGRVLQRHDHGVGHAGGDQDRRRDARDSRRSQTIVVAGAITVVYSDAGRTDRRADHRLLPVRRRHGRLGGRGRLGAATDRRSADSRACSRIPRSPGEARASCPTSATNEVALAVFVIPLAVQWWSVWYPGSEPGGGGYVAQRMLAAKNEGHAQGATLLFNVAHYALRPWPWILVALRVAGRLPRPRLAAQRLSRRRPAASSSDDLAYPAMLTLLPAGLLGLVVASLARGLHVDDLHPPQLGLVLRRARLLPALRATRRRANASWCASAVCRRWSSMVAAGALVAAASRTPCRPSRSCCRSAPAPACSSSCAGSGGGSTLRAELSRWPFRSWSRSVFPVRSTPGSVGAPLPVRSNWSRRGDHHGRVGDGGVPRAADRRGDAAPLRRATRPGGPGWNGARRAAAAAASRSPRGSASCRWGSPARRSAASRSCRRSSPPGRCSTAAAGRRRLSGRLAAAARSAA